MKSQRLLFAGLLLASAQFASAAPLFESVTLHPLFPNHRPNYRIPAILNAPNHDLLVFSEKRIDGIGDIGYHQLVLDRSSDLGRTWGKEELIYDDPPDRVCADITLCVDRDHGRIFLFFLKDKKRYCYMSSDDSGKTWNGPVDVHTSVTRPEWDTVGLKTGASGADGQIDPDSRGNSHAKVWGKNWVQRYGVGPGAGGIQISQGPHKGRLLIPARHKEQVGDKIYNYSHVFFSDDHGATWHLGPNVARYGNECRMVELPNGDVMISMRNSNPADEPDNSRRLVSISHDGGDTWDQPYRDDALVSSTVHAGLRVYDYPASPDNGLLLFSNEASPIRTKEHPYGRYNLTVRWSRDNGQLWSAGRPIYPHACSYSDMAVLDDGTIGMVYEQGAKGSTYYEDELQFVRFNLEWLMAPAHTPVP